MSIKASFLRAVLGEEGASALQKASRRSQELEAAIAPRALLSWLTFAADNEYEGEIPGVEDTYMQICKTETGFTGQVSIGDSFHSFEDESVYHVAASLAVAMGLDNEEFDPRLKDLDIARLGKSIDLLVKARSATETLLSKSVLDPKLGYSFQIKHSNFPVAAKIRHKHTDGSYSEPHDMPASTTIYAHSPEGEHIGHVTFAHFGDKLKAVGVHVDENHRRRGIASHMYALAEQATGKTAVPSNALLDDGKALWQGNQASPQFGLKKTDLPAKTAMPVEQAGPLLPDPPSKQVGMIPRAGKKPKLPKLPRPSMALPKLKLSEAQLLAPCPVCSGSQMKGDKLSGCLCFKAMMKSVTMEKTKDGLLLSFGQDWDDEAVMTFLENVRGKQ